MFHDLLTRPAHTRYRKSVVDVPESPPSSGLFVLKSATSNKKLGGGSSVVTKGRYRGMPLYSLTLEERATCWDGCQNWGRCYGDNMPFAKRYVPGDALEDAIARDVARLHAKHPAGFVVRLHVLGDFYSPAYVRFWHELQRATPSLHVFGYTHWPPGSAIGYEVTQWVLAEPDRVAIRRSDATDPHDPLPPAYTVTRLADVVGDSVVCPEQTGRTASCSTCGLCMDQRVAISFLDHSRQALRVLATPG
jgi:hypothetical protein